MSPDAPNNLTSDENVVKYLGPMAHTGEIQIKRFAVEVAENYRLQRYLKTVAVGISHEPFGKRMLRNDFLEPEPGFFDDTGMGVDMFTKMAGQELWTLTHVFGYGDFLYVARQPVAEPGSSKFDFDPLYTPMVVTALIDARAGGLKETEALYGSKEVKKAAEEYGMLLHIPEVKRDSASLIATHGADLYLLEKMYKRVSELTARSLEPLSHIAPDTPTI